MSHKQSAVLKFQQHTSNEMTKFTKACDQKQIDRLNETKYHSFSPIRAGGGAESARTFFRWLFLHEERSLEVQNFVAFPNSL